MRVGNNEYKHSCSGVGEKQNLIALFWEVISEARKIFLYMSKRCPKKPHSLQSDISMFKVQHLQLPIITHMVLFDLTDFYCEYKYNTIIIRRAPPGTITLLIAGIYMCVSPRYHFTNEFIKTSNESTKLPIG